MQDFPPIIKGTRFHMVGIKGTGMAALAELLSAQGAVITGSDYAAVFYTDEIIRRLGLAALPFSGGNITDDVDCVIHSSAYNAQTNPDLMAAAARGVPTFLYTQALGAVSERAYSVGICGVHGKTSTTGLTGTILKQLPLSSAALAGSVITSFGAAPVHSCVMTTDGSGFDTFSLSRYSKENTQPPVTPRRFFVAETCEYQRHFMSFHPQKIVITSVESDHQDYYPTYEDILAAFVDYICLLPNGGEVIYCADDKGAVEAVERARTKRPDLALTPYGTTAEGDYRVTMGDVGDGEWKGDDPVIARVAKQPVQHFSLGCMDGLALHVPGRHEVLDAAAAVAAARGLLIADGKNPDDYNDSIAHGVAAFTGGKRRSEVVGHCIIGGNDTIFIDDYGHHPTAIRTTLQGYREFYRGRRIVVDFMSHTYTRTAALLEDFAQAFGDADDIIVNKIYGSAREGGADIHEMTIDGVAVSGKVLAERTAKYHRHAVYASEFDEAAKVALAILRAPLPHEYPNGCLFVTMGAGDNWKVGEMVKSAK